MQNSVNDFEAYYVEQMNCENQLPGFITEFFRTEACLAVSETKCIYIVSDIIFNKKYILKQVSKKLLSHSEKE